MRGDLDWLPTSLRKNPESIYHFQRTDHCFSSLYAQETYANVVRMADFTFFRKVSEVGSSMHGNLL